MFLFILVDWIVKDLLVCFVISEVCDFSPTFQNNRTLYHKMLGLSRG